MSMEVIQLDEDSDGEIDKLQSPGNVISIQSDQGSQIEEGFEILVETDTEEEVVCLDDTSTDSDNDDVGIAEDIKIDSRRRSTHSSQENQVLPILSASTIEKTDDNAVDLFDFEEACEENTFEVHDNLNEDLNTFDDYRSETVEELREIISSDEDEKNSNVGDVLSEKLLSSSDNQAVNITRDLEFKMFGHQDQVFLSLKSLKLLFHSNENNFLDELMGIIEKEGLTASECVKFAGWSVSHVSLTALNLIRSHHILLPRTETVSGLLRQLQPSNCHVRIIRDEHRETVGGRKTQEVEVSHETEKAEVIEVSQNREMKRKGLRLPPGWRVLGVKTEARLETLGELHTCIKIDWKYKSPDGVVYHDLKAALKAVKKKITKYEKWEILKDKEVKILEAAPSYVTLKQQYDDELDQALERDVFAVSGVRPVRKFPENSVIQTQSKLPQKERSVAPIRMSAPLKSNPISLAQREKMERKSSQASRRFKLNEVSVVESCFQHDGWFSSKLMTLKFLSGGRRINVRDSPSPLRPPDHFSPLPNKVQVKVHDDTKGQLIEDLVNLRSPTPSPSVPSSRNTPNFHRRLVMIPNLPPSWAIKQGDSGSVHFISPDGELFQNLESVLQKTKDSDKPLHTPKKRKDVPTDSPVIRKVPRLSLQKASLEVEALVATQMEEDIDNLLLESDTD